MWLLLGVLLLVESALSFECGILADASRIVGGEDVGSFKYPWFASLHPPGDAFQVCAGALISPHYVLSAAHCFPKKDGKTLEELYEITLGIHNSCKIPPTAETFKVIKVDVHENYTDAVKLFDIALVTLDGESTFTPVCLPQADDPIVRMRAKIMGFGSQKYGSPSKNCEMQEATVHIYTPEYCKESTSMPIALTTLLEKTGSAFCAGESKGGKDTCQGDSGGPLIVHMAGKYVQKGVVSFGYGCGKLSFPGIYTHTASYIDWLSSRIEGGLPPGIASPPTTTTMKKKKNCKTAKKKKTG